MDASKSWDERRAGTITGPQWQFIVGARDRAAQRTEVSDEEQARRRATGTAPPPRFGRPPPGCRGM